MNATDIRYYINPEKKTIVAVADNCMADALEALNKANNGSHIPNMALLEMPDTFRGKAKCHPNDEWNEEIGKRVAREKLYRSYNKCKANAICRYLDKLVEFINTSAVIEDRIRSRSLD